MREEIRELFNSYGFYNDMLNENPRSRREAAEEMRVNHAISTLEDYPRNSPAALYLPEQEAEVAKKIVLNYLNKKTKSSNPVIRRGARRLKSSLLDILEEKKKLAK